MQRIFADQLGDLLGQPWLARPGIYPKDGTFLLSPFWFDGNGGAFLLALLRGNVKEPHVGRMPQASLLTAGEGPYPAEPSRSPASRPWCPTLAGQAIKRIAARHMAMPSALAGTAVFGP
jgi:hypothetical protein